VSLLGLQMPVLPAVQCHVLPLGVVVPNNLSDGSALESWVCFSPIFAWQAH
jgi:hypothetical protein